MTGLFIGDTLITRYLRAVTQRSTRKIVTTLLDGSDHVQILGSQITRISIELAVDVEGRDLIDAADATGDLLTLNDEQGDTYNGRILERGEWVKMLKGYYQSTLTLSTEAVV